MYTTIHVFSECKPLPLHTIHALSMLLLNPISRRRGCYASGIYPEDVKGESVCPMKFLQIAEHPTAGQSLSITIS